MRPRQGQPAQPLAKPPRDRQDRNRHRNIVAKAGETDPMTGPLEWILALNACRAGRPAAAGPATQRRGSPHGAAGSAQPA